MSGDSEELGPSDPASRNPSAGRRRQALAAVALLAILGAAVTAGWSLVADGDRHRQPIGFSHRLHVEDLGAECADCHLQVLRGARATIPNLDVCADCHEEAMTESPAEARLVELIAEGQPIPWLKIYRVPPDVYFSHRRHAALGGLECEVCHGPVATFETPVTRRAVAVTMAGCMRCHDERGISNDCISCHR